MPHAVHAHGCQDLRQRLTFETLLSEISTQFINLPIDRIDNFIERAQWRICECLGFDTSTLWQWSAEQPRLMKLTHMYSPPGGPARLAQLDAEQAFPWTCQRILKGVTFVVNTDELTKEASRDWDRRRRYGKRSSVVIPLKAGGKPTMGVLSFGNLHKEHGWTAESLKRLEHVARIFCSALVRKQDDNLLRESEIRLNLAVESAAVGVWEYDSLTRKFWFNEQARAIHGFHQHKVISMSGFEGSLHPDDIPGFRQAIGEAVEKGSLLDILYRIRIGADLRWMCSRGRPYCRNGGKVNRLLGVSIDISEYRLRDQLGCSAATAATKEYEKLDLASIERNHITHVLRRTEWKIEGPGGAASILDLHPSTLRFRIKKLGIVRPI